MSFKNQGGFSIVQGLLLAGLLSGTALVTSQLVSDQKKAAEAVESKDAVDELSKIVYSFLQNQEHCRATLTNNGAAITALPMNNKREINAIYVANVNTTDTSFTANPIFVKNQNYFGNAFKIREMFVDYSGGLNPAKLEIHITRHNVNDRTGKGLGGKDLKKIFPIVIKTNNLYQFDSCYAVKEEVSGTGEGGNLALAKELCDSLSEMFDWDTNRNRCVVKNSMCPDGQFLVGISSTGLQTSVERNVFAHGGVSIADKVYGDIRVNSIGNVHCRSPRQAFSISDYVDITQSNCVNRHGVRLVKSGNKVKIGCL